MSRLMALKPLEAILKESAETGAHSLKRSLGALNLTSLGVGAIIGTGIFVLVGVAAAQYAGPAIVLSFVLAGTGAAFAGLCYAEFAALIPVAGSAYTYGYATLGEIFAWIIGWDLILEYAFGASAVAAGWSGYVVNFLQSIGMPLSPSLIASPGTEMVYFQNQWVGITTLPMGTATGALPHAHGVFNLVAFAGIMLATAILVLGVKESANLNSAIVILKVAIVLVFIGTAASYLFRHPEVSAHNWHPFIPPNEGTFGRYGWSGIARGASLVFFAYIGFDAVSTAAQETKNPQRNLPIGILGSLAICTVLYIIVAGLLTGVVNYSQLNVAAPVALGIDSTGAHWGALVVKVGVIIGLSSTMIVMLLGQSRVFFSMSKDGLLPQWAAAVHPRFRTPWISTIVVGLAAAVISALFPLQVLGEMTNIGTYLAFVIVCAGVWILRRRRPQLDRPFRTPWVPFVPLAGMLISLFMMGTLPLATWIRLLAWLALGMVLYFAYGQRHSRVQAALAEPLLEKQTVR